MLGMEEISSGKAEVKAGELWDKVWLLVGILLRRGESCTSTELALECNLCKLTPPEIETLCQFPNSPLSFTKDGKVTFSHLAFSLFNEAGNRFQRNPHRPALSDGSMPIRFSCSQDLLTYITRFLSIQPQYHRSRHSHTRSTFELSQHFISHILQLYAALPNPTAPQEFFVALQTWLNSNYCMKISSGKRRKRAASSTGFISGSNPKRLKDSTCRFSEISGDEKADDSPDPEGCEKSGKLIVLPSSLYIQGDRHDIKADAKIDEEGIDTQIDQPFDKDVKQVSMAALESKPYCHRVGVSVDAMELCVPDSEDCMVIADIQKTRTNNTEILDQLKSPKAGIKKPNTTTTVAKPVKVKEKVKEKAKEKVRKSATQKLDTKKQINQSAKANKPNGSIEQVAGQTLAHPLAEQPVGSKQLEAKMPNFEGFVVESLEGSGGYGTVFKALRKSDGQIFAIKCPLEKTSQTYVMNEIKVLQKFRGKQLIPKFEGVIKESGRDCIILEHIDHERPEILKKELSISDLQWYGYSLFKVLAMLHEKGVTHRDVKPGNFLFSRKRQNGYLVDFNLAVVQQRQASARTKRSLVDHQSSGNVSVSSSYLSNSHADSMREVNASFTNDGGSARKQQKLMSGYRPTQMLKMDLNREEASSPSGKGCTTPVHAWKQAQSTPSKMHLSSNRGLNVKHMNEQGSRASVLEKSSHKDLRASPRAAYIPDRGSPAFKSKPQVPTFMSPSREQDDALHSGLTTTHMGVDSIKEPLPKSGRKELREYAIKAMSSPQPPPLIGSLLGSQRKRVAAPRKKKVSKNLQERGLLDTTLTKKQNYVAIPSGHQNLKKGRRKNQKEGPCAGTKGYRAPEVLLRSVFQSVKIDVWSAGVTMLQLFLGKSPFSSSSMDQSLFDIARLSGSEAMLNLAKECCREDGLPKDFSEKEKECEGVSLKEWCKELSRRPEMLECAPPSFYELLERCLQVNPRDRPSASEALQHDFFAPCHPATSKSSAVT